jgi:hypothetical protein
MRKKVYMSNYEFTVNLKMFSKSLIGRISGMRHFTEVCVKLANAPLGAPIVLDFSGIKHVTGSWINSMIVPFFKWAAQSQNDVFPILYNVDEEWLDEFRLVAQWNHQCYLIARSTSFPPKQVQLIGFLEPAQRISLHAVLSENEVTGAELNRKRAEKIGATAWNNRLKELYLKRLVCREKRGRNHVYFSLCKEIKENGRQLSETAS